MSLPNELLPVGLLATGDTQYRIERSLRFNSADSAYCGRTVSSANTSNTTATLSWWVKRAKLGANGCMFSGYDGSSPYATYIEFDTGDTLSVTNPGYNLALRTTQVFRDTSAWYHFVLIWDTSNATSTDRYQLYVNGSRITTFSTAVYPSQNDTGRFIYANANNRIGTTWGSSGYSYFDGYLADIHFIDGQALTPSSFAETNTTTGQWVPKAYRGTYGTNGFRLAFADNSNNTATTLGKDSSGNGNNWTPNNLSVNQTTVNYNAAISTENCSIDTGGYGPISNGFDGNSGTLFRTTGGAANGGNATIVFAPSTAITVGSSLVFRGYIGANQGYEVRIGTTVLASGTNDPSANTDWTVPNAAGLTISTSTPLRLIAKNNSSIGGEGVYWNRLVVDGVELVNRSASDNDSLVDTPTSYGTDTGAGGSVRGNYATWNPLANSGLTLTNGNLNASYSSAAWKGVKSTIAVSSGKYYCECTVGGAFTQFGIVKASVTADNYAAASESNDGTGYIYAGNNGYLYGASLTSGATVTQGDVIGLAINLDANQVTFYKNNVAQYTNISILSGQYAIACSINNESVAGSINFGQRPFAYTAPSGFKALCDTNLPAPVVAKPNTAFDVVLYTGNGSSSRSITGLQFSPDFIWGKERNSTNWHNLVDIVRGASKRLYSNSTNVEEDVPTSFISFDSGGFTIGNDNATNENNAPYVAWCWDAGSSTTTNTQGSITSSVRANPSAGFSIVSYTGNGTQGASVGHGLGVAPSMVIYKQRNDSRDWLVYHASLGATAALYLNQTLGAVTSANHFNNTAPNSTTLYLNSSPPADQTNVNGGTYVAYCFAPVAGYSAFGSYTGNGSTDGPFVYTGFRPRFILTKASSTTDVWNIVDTGRSPYNAAKENIWPNQSSAEDATTAGMDILSNGFKPRNQFNYNGSGVTYVYAAFAESPFQYSRAR